VGLTAKYQARAHPLQAHLMMDQMVFFTALMAGQSEAHLGHAHAQLAIQVMVVQAVKHQGYAGQVRTHLITAVTGRFTALMAGRLEAHLGCAHAHLAIQGMVGQAAK
tara:strand:+ start:5905 stop:6225 length:321 start_codon:yes stop_codon:yes gene_type:complete